MLGLSGLISLIDSHADKRMIFRGVPKQSYHLVPAIGRAFPEFGNNQYEITEKAERDLLLEFKRRSIPYRTQSNERHDLDILAIGQHYGLPTRLLDWTSNLLVALFFAVRHNYDGGTAAIYAVPRPPECESQDLNDPLSIGSVKLFQPNYIAPRIVSQQGLFTIHPRPYKPWEPECGMKIILEENNILQLSRELKLTGTTQEMLFPGIDGVAAVVKSEVFSIGSLHSGASGVKTVFRGL